MSHRQRLAIALAVAAAVGAWIGLLWAPPPQPPWFRDITAAVGVDFRHDPGPFGSYFMPQIFGSGAAIFDFDQDGRLDLLFLQSGGPASGETNQLYRQTEAGRFVNVSAGSGLDFSGWNSGVAVGDVNNDGRPDVVVTQYAGIKLLRNLGHGQFRDVAVEAGLSNPTWGTSAAFFDFDRDGWLDLVVVNYLDYDKQEPCTGPHGVKDFCHPQNYRGTVTRLFRNVSAGQPDGAIRFTDVTLASGLGRTPGPGLGVLCADFDGDAWPDVLVANDGAANHLWINQRDGTFKDEALARGLAYHLLGRPQANMGVAHGDVDRDGLADVFVTHLDTETHTLWRQGPRGSYHDATATAGLLRLPWQGTGFGVTLADFDLDGALDLMLVNGGVRKRRVNAAARLGPWGWYAERAQLFANDGGGRFHDRTALNPELCRAAAVGRGLAWGDLDGDGRLDVVVTNVAGPAQVFQNVAARQGHWLRVHARLTCSRPDGTTVERDAAGSEIEVVAGGRTWTRLLSPNDSYLCSSEPAAHFGLGHVAHVDSIRVRWPGGAVESYPGGAVDGVVTIKRSVDR